MIKFTLRAFLLHLPGATLQEDTIGLIPYVHPMRPLRYVFEETWGNPRLEANMIKYTLRTFLLHLPGATLQEDTIGLIP
jgi:hypothetical protein